jgi:hypothetical protein
MNISINGKPADIVPDTEKTVGEVLSGLEQWLAGSGHRLSGLSINGEPVPPAGMAAAFGRSLEGIASLGLVTSAWAELAAEALTLTRETLRQWEAADFGGRFPIREGWESGPAAQFLSGEAPDLFSLAAGTLRGEGPGPAELSGLIDERLREMVDPRGEFSLAEPLVGAVAGRLEELPLDIQTGKDGRAAETVQLFSHIAEKLFRLLYFMKTDGLPAEGLMVEELPAREFIGEFGAALKELLAAYETRDTVLVGDLAEYELAPRLRKLYGAMKIAASAAGPAASPR